MTLLNDLILLSPLFLAYLIFLLLIFGLSYFFTSYFWLLILWLIWCRIDLTIVWSQPVCLCLTCTNTLWSHRAYQRSNVSWCAPFPVYIVCPAIWSVKHAPWLLCCWADHGGYGKGVYYVFLHNKTTTCSVGLAGCGWLCALCVEWLSSWRMARLFLGWHVMPFINRQTPLLGQNRRHYG